MSPQTSSDIPETASPTPDGLIPAPRKRKRNVLSCLDCRRRKVKCDHGLPACSRCRQRGIASSCTYEYSAADGNGHQGDRAKPSDEDPLTEKASALSGSDQSGTSYTTQIPLASTSAYLEQKDMITRLENRLNILEAAVANGHSTSCAALKPEFQGIVPKQPEANFFKGRGYRTQFYGASCPNSVLASFPEIRAIMKEAHPGSALERLQSERKAVEARRKFSKAQVPKKPSVNLISLVPERAVTDHFVQLYISTFEQTYRILHQPTFWIDYETFWKSPQDSKLGFAAVLLLILASVRCMSPKQEWSFDLNGSSARSEAILWILACDSWLQQQSQKHRTVAMYQVMCLRVLAASANSLKVKQAKLFAEALLEYFKAAGMHRDPSMLEGRCSAFEQEMRRRFWATVMELELQSSLDRGTPSSLSSTPFDCKPPLNLNDEDLVIDAVRNPIPAPSGKYTSTSYLHVASRSISLRINLCSLINDPQFNLGYGEVLRYEQEINEELDAIPKWGDGKVKGQDYASALLDLQLRQYLIMLHTPYARKSYSSQNRYSRMVCFETSKYILDLHHKLVCSGNHVLCLVRSDILYATLSICHNAFLCTIDPGNMFFNGMLSNFAPILSDAFKLLEEKFMRLGRGYDHFWWVSAACSIVQAKLEPELAEEIKLQATERVAELYRKKLAHMETNSLTQHETDIASMHNGESTEGNWTPHYLNESNGISDIHELFDPSDWTLDNLWPLEGIYDPGVLL